jgi:hypothetical protein
LGGHILKKGLITACILILVVLGLIVFAHVNNQGNKLSKMLQINYADITRVEFLNGRTGERTTVEDRVKIKEFMGLVDSYVIKRIKGYPEIKPGTAYSVKFYMGASKAFTLQLISLDSGSNLGINGVEYKVIKTDLTIEKIDRFLNYLTSSSFSSKRL